MKHDSHIVKFENRAEIEFKVPGERARDVAEARQVLIDAINKLPDGAFRSAVGFRLTVVA